jgi:hypothetical protein
MGWFARCVIAAERRGIAIVGQITPTYARRSAMPRSGSQNGIIGKTTPKCAATFSNQGGAASNSGPRALLALRAEA